MDQLALVNMHASENDSVPVVIKTFYFKSPNAKWVKSSKCK